MLLPKKTDKKELVQNKACIVTGFGSVDGKGTLPDYLQQVHVNVAKHSDCKTLFQQRGILVDESMICAGKLKGMYDSCPGDSGGPLVCRHSVGFDYYLHGVVSWGLEGCGIANQYGVYANVIYFLDWIKGNAV